jgi:hypothetical protein
MDRTIAAVSGASRKGGMDRDAGRPKLVGILHAVLLLVHQDEVRLELDDARGFRVLGPAQLFDLIDQLGGVHAELRPSDELSTGTEVEDQLGQRGTQGYDSHVLGSVATRVMPRK